MKRRNFIIGLASIAPAATILAPAILSAKDTKPKSPNSMDLETALKAITNGKDIKGSDKVKLTVPEIAENGAVVPVKVEVDHPMDENNYVQSIHIIATGNTNVRSVDAMLTPLNAKGYFATRIKLGKSQDVLALVALSNGEFMSAKKPVKVTIGGCG
jgi:sulfur-oxidizing protein SoxY